MVTGRIFDIERFSTADGPGIRTVVFFKGCNLNCYWCHNPESIRAVAELELEESRCIGCGQCVAVCPRGAHSFDQGHVINREICSRCFSCVQNCPAGALRQVGREVTVEEVLREIREDAPFYSRSGGGVTLSGGEVLMQADFARELLMACKAEGLHTAIESNLCFPTDRLAMLVPWLDLIMADIKHLDDQAHRQATGKGNNLVMQNIRWLNRQKAPLILRTPVIPGFNDDEAFFQQVSDFLSQLQNLQYYELLSYNPMGNDKRRRLGYDVPGITVPSKAQMRAFGQIAARCGKQIWIDGTVLT